MLRAIVLLLTCAAGSVDAASYIALGHVFTANMTGNTVHFGVAIGRWDPATIARTGTVLVGFAVGVACGALIVERDESIAVLPRSVIHALALELIVLVLAAAGWPAGWVATDVGQHVMLGLLAVAMGTQSAAVRRMRIPGVVTTYITGTVTSFVASEVRRRLGYERPTPEAPTHGTPLLGLVWLVYVGGAIVTTMTASGRSGRSLAIPILLLAASIAGGIWYRRRTRGGEEGRPTNSSSAFS